MCARVCMCFVCCQWTHLSIILNTAFWYETHQCTKHTSFLRNFTNFQQNRRIKMDIFSHFLQTTPKSNKYLQYLCRLRNRTNTIFVSIPKSYYPTTFLLPNDDFFFEKKNKPFSLMHMTLNLAYYLYKYSLFDIIVNAFQNKRKFFEIWFLLHFFFFISRRLLYFV